MDVRFVVRRLPSGAYEVCAPNGKRKGLRWSKKEADRLRRKLEDEARRHYDGL